MKRRTIHVWVCVFAKPLFFTFQSFYNDPIIFTIKKTMQNKQGDFKALFKGFKEAQLMPMWNTSGQVSDLFRLQATHKQRRGEAGSHPPAPG